MAEFAVIDGWVRFDRLTDGRAMCCICCDYTKPEDLHVDLDGQKWDLCIGCGIMENLTTARWPG